MSSAQSWKGIDPKLREAAARQGMSLSEYLNQALQSQQGFESGAEPRGFHAPTSRMRPVRAGGASFVDEDENDWSVGQAPMTRSLDPAHLAQRIEAIERRTQLAVTGLDRAVSTIDRSVMGLAARVEDAEAISQESAGRIAEALDHFRVASDTLGGRLQSAEYAIDESRDALSGARGELQDARSRLEQQALTAENIARKAEATAEFLAQELDNRQAQLAGRIDGVEAKTREALEQSLSEAREAADQAAEASFAAVSELRALQHRLAERMHESEESTRRAIGEAVEQTRAQADKLNETLLQEVVRLESEIGAGIQSAESVREEQKALLARIEKAETSAREATAGLRQAAGAAIADLRNAQLGLTARLKQVEDSGGQGGGDLSDVRAQQAEIAERLAQLEAKGETNPVDDALSAFQRRLEQVEQGMGGEAVQQKLDEVDGAVKSIDESLQRLADRMAETESTANSAIRTLEETVSGLSARFEAQDHGNTETEALRAMLESRLDEMAQSVQAMVGQARDEFAGQVDAAMQSGAGEGLEEALADVNRRLAAAERRQAQTIEAISIEIKRMSETVDRRLRTVEARNDDAAGAAVREELAKMSQTLESRFEEIERREAAAFDRMGLEVGRLSERLEERVGAVETRSAQAIEHVGDQVARMAERFSQRQDQISRELGERMIDSEERNSARVSEAVSSMMQRLSEVEERSAEAVTPVQKAVSSMAARLEQMSHDADFPSAPSLVEQHYSNSPMSAAQPMRAGPITPAPAPQPHHDDDIYFADPDEDDAPASPTPSDALAAAEAAVDDDLLDDTFLDDVDAFAPSPPEDEADDAFWASETEAAPQPEAQTESAPADELDLDVEASSDFDLVDAAAPAREDPGLDAENDLIFEDAPAHEPPPAPSKNDYLAAARKAAQAQAAPTKERGKPERKSAAAGAPQLRGPSRVVLWGAAGAIALSIAGGAWYYKNHIANPAGPAPDAPEPDLSAPDQQTPPPATPYDPETPFGAEITDPAEAATGEDGAPAEEPEGAATSSEGAQEQPVVAGPLARRAMSLEQAADGGDSVAQYELALQRLSAGRTADGVQLLRRAADRGLAMAQYRLGKLYERGEGVPPDLNLARQWTERAAGAGNRRAMHDLGVYFARGEGAPLDEAAAFRWFRQAAELGVADSQYNLGVLYQQGRGVGSSASEALFWFLVAARQGDQDAASRGEALQAQLPAMQVEQARARAQAFRPRAASAVANGDFGPRAWSSAPARSGA